MSLGVDCPVLLCERTDLLFDPDPTQDPIRDRCLGCYTEVWVSSRTLERVAREVPGRSPMILCNACGEGFVENAVDGVEYHLTTRQEWMRPFLPVPRTKQRRRR